MGNAGRMAWLASMSMLGFASCGQDRACPVPVIACGEYRLSGLSSLTADEFPALKGATVLIEPESVTIVLAPPAGGHHELQYDVEVDGDFGNCSR